MNSDSIATIDLASAAKPPEPPEAPRPSPRSPRWLAPSGRFLAIGLCLGLAGVLQVRGLDWAASAASWLDGVARPGGVPDVGLVALLWRKSAAVGLSLGQAVSVWQFAAAGGLLATVLLAAWQLRGLTAAIAAVGLFLLWPLSRGLLTTVGAEAPLAAALLLAVLAGLIAWARPLLSAVLLGVALACLVLLHPLGLPLAVVALLAVLILPLRRGVEPLAGVEPHEGLWPHAVTVPNLAGFALAAGIVAATYGAGGLKLAWTRQIAEWRAPTVAPLLGGVADWPLLGPLVVFAGQITTPVLVLACAAAVGAIRRPSDPTALPSAVVFGTALALVWLGLPTPGLVDGVALLAPGLILLAAVLAVDVARELWARGSPGVRAGGVVLAIATLLAFLADQRLAAPDRRNLLAHLPGIMATSLGAQPAVLRPADMGLLYRKPVATGILPGHLGGNALATALRQLHPPLQGVNFGAAFSMDQMLVTPASGGSVEAMWAQIGRDPVCTADGRTCLVRIRVK